MQSVTMNTNSIILLLVLYTSCLCSTRGVYIQPSEGEHCPGTPCYNISTFGRMARNNFSNTYGLVVHFLEGTHFLYLQELVVFTNLTNATFKGNGRMEQGFHETVWQSTVVIKCTEHSSTGIAFANSSNITFRYITITNCGADMTSITDFQPPPINPSLGYFNVNNFFIDHVSVQNGSSSGLLIITDGADLSIAASSFAQNGLGHNPTMLPTNVFIIYNNPLSCDPHKYVYNVLITNTNISALYSHSSGVTMEISQTTYSVTIILDSVQSYGNGYGYSNIEICSANVPNYNLIINNSNIEGAPLVIITKPFLYIHKCSTNISKPNTNISIVNSKFNYIINKLVGSIAIGFEDINYPVTIIINSTEISHNIVSRNALYILSLAYEDKVVIVLQNVTINNNSCSWATNNHNSTFLQPSAVRTEFVGNLVLNNVNITNNNATGLLAYRTVVSVNSDSTSIFHNNTGIDGGGLAMYGESYLVFKENSILHFINNKAMNKGGAIFVNVMLPNFPCFYQYSDGTPPQSTKATFYDNNAKIAGTVLFGGVQDCNYFISPNNYTDVFFSMTFNYSSQTGPSVISSEPTDVCFCDDNNTINCSQTQLTMTAYPGEEINISVVTVGQRDGVAPGLIKIQPLDLKSAPVEIYNTIAVNCTTIAFTPIHDTYSLSIVGTIGYNSKTLNINKTDCPLGFQLSKKNGACDCEEVKHINPLVYITCDAATNTLSRQGDIWIGNISECIIVQTPCPLDYCNSTKANFTFADPDSQCAKNRNGTLCGGCKNNFSLALGSNNCIECNQFSYLALLITFAAAGFGLVALLMVLNLTVSIGTINGLIFYASMVKISESTGVFPNGPIPVLSQFIAWLNLDLGIEICFYPGMTAYHKVWLQFVFPLYIWFIIATIIVLCRYSTWLSNKIGGNVVQVLATLILLSFTKIFRTAVLAIKFEKLGCVYGNANASVVWYVDGNVPYLSPEHAVLMAAAVLFLLIGVPYTLALLFDAVIEKYLTRIRCFRRQWIKLKPFVDAYHGPYKDNCRFWTGLLLLVRMSFTLVSLELDTYTALIFITTSTGVLLSLMIFFGGIYQNKYRNFLEWSSLFNLILLSAIYSALNGKTDAQQVVTIISVSVAFIIFLGVITFHVLLRAKMIDILGRFIEKIHCKNEETRSLLDPNEEHVHQNLEQPTSSDVWLKRETLIFQS